MPGTHFTRIQRPAMALALLILNISIKLSRWDSATQPAGIVHPLSSSISDVTQHDTLLNLCVNVGAMGSMTAPKRLSSLRTTRSVTTWLMLLLLFGDIHLNPGPPMNQSIYPLWLLRPSGELVPSSSMLWQVWHLVSQVLRKHAVERVRGNRRCVVELHLEVQVAKCRKLHLPFLWRHNAQHIRAPGIHTWRWLCLRLTSIVSPERSQQSCQHKTTASDEFHCIFLSPCS